jgi:hypothetical protein
MKTQQGSAAVAGIVAILVILALGVGGYMVMREDAVVTDEHAGGGDETTHEAAPSHKISITWQLTDAGEVDAVPHTAVTAVVNGTKYDMGTFAGSCTELNDGGIDGAGLLTGELSAVQCWFAGGGDEIGVFANEHGGVDIMTGTLSEGDATTAFFRGDFTVRHAVTFGTPAM